jgi:hypothetical protein
LLPCSKPSLEGNDIIEFGCAFTLGFVSGGALIWFYKTRIQALVVDANSLAAKLHAEANAVTALIRKP